ncbi:putative late blight resistance protein homolog R1B-16 [Salvia miltiorrhiza]|uniref:putative late blight resistance protein homolog R1B-16 n=1 Tax=Salvia miltiorrhiza TaxID=226208 RepID=UPI0025AC0BCD|nr:putative late blight resistance protein homolog R1B-16 [Salvia miltiorrhiza]
MAEPDMREDEVGLALYKYLFGRRFLIVLDDMWSIEAWEKLQGYFPDNGNSSRIMVTSRLSNLGSRLDDNYGLKIKLLDVESSWRLFCKVVFGGESCPLELEKIGKKIVKSCRGLPLSIVLLEKLERTKECWKSIRRSLNSAVNSENDKHCWKILKFSYKHLPCFLYMGMFEEDSEIHVSTVVKLWVSEGFLKSITGKSLETVAEEYLKELVDRNLILVPELGKTGSIKYCKIHDLLREFCMREAQKERFYHVVGQHSPQGTCSQCRLVIPRGTSKKEVLDAVESTPHARSYISDWKRVRLLPNLRLLRTLKAYDKDIWRIHHYSLEKMFELVNLRLLVVKADRCGQLPSSINLLWSLQTLIVYPDEPIINAPVEIWKMPQLRHVDFNRGLHLPDPPSNSIVIMENLHTLNGVRNFKCDEEIVGRILNIKKLVLTICEPRDDDYCVHNIECLQKLESLSFICVRRSVFLQKLTLPHSLKSLDLQMWMGRMKDILEKVSTLPLLQKLKLMNGRFKTGKWATVEGQFPSLKLLSLTSCCNLKYWMMESSHFPCLEHLHLHKIDLKEIPTELGDIPTLKSVALKLCEKSLVKSAKRMIEEQGEVSFKVEVQIPEEHGELLSLLNPNFQVTVLPF